MRKSLSKRSEIIAIGIIFIVSVFLRYFVCGRVILARTYPDELRYYQIAQSIASGRGISIYNSHTNFSKVLYSLLISPAFLVKDRLVQIKLIEFINAFLVSLTIPVTGLFSKKIITNSNLRIMACMFCAVLPDFIYSMTYLSETAFMPMAMLLFYGVYELLDSDTTLKAGIIRGAILGVGIYLLYITKEIALVFILLVVSMCILFGVKKQLNGLYAGAALFLAFALCFTFAKFTVFRGMGSSYDQTGIEILKEPGRIGFLFYGFFYYLMNVIFSGGVLIIVPILRYSELSDKSKRLLWMSGILLLLSAVTVAYTITVREDFEGGLPRAHMRYICYIWPVLIIILLSLFESAEKKINVICMSVFGAVMLIVLIMYKGTLDLSGRDQQMLNMLVGKQEIVLLLYKLLLLIIMLFTVCANKQLRKPLLTILVTIFVVVQISNNYAGIKYNRKVNKISEKEMQEVNELAELIKANKDKNFVIISDNTKLNKKQNLIDTFLAYDNVYVMNGECFLERQSEDGLDVYETELQSLLPECDYLLGLDVDYVLLKRDTGLCFDKDDYQDMTIGNEIAATYNVGGKRIVSHIAIAE